MSFCKKKLVMRSSKWISIPKKEKLRKKYIANSGYSKTSNLSNHSRICQKLCEHQCELVFGSSVPHLWVTSIVRTGLKWTSRSLQKIWPLRERNNRWSRILWQLCLSIFNKLGLQRCLFPMSITYFDILPRSTTTLHCSLPSSPPRNHCQWCDWNLTLHIWHKKFTTSSEGWTFARGRVLQEW